MCVREEEKAGQDGKKDSEYMKGERDAREVEKKEGGFEREGEEERERDPPQALSSDKAVVLQALRQVLYLARACL